MKLNICISILTIVLLIACKNQNPPTTELISEDNSFVTEENLALEAIHREKLEPIISLKTSEPKIYWFIVSWLNTNYKTPNWEGYNSDGWKEKTKKRGIDCSGFSRVMQDVIFNKKIRGSSQGILNNYSQRRKVKELELGDLVFFRAPFSKTNRVTHMGVYLMNNYFVHATSKKSAAIGLGLSINSLDEKIWSNDFVSGGEIK